MAAVMTERREPEGYGNELLWEWGAWNKDDGDGRASWSVKPRIGTVHAGVPPEKINVVDKILAPIKRDHKRTYAMVDQFYRREKALWQVGLAVDRSPAEVLDSLQRVAWLVEREYNDWQKRKKSDA